MADEDGGGSFGFLTRKVGPMPVWGWGLIVVGIYYWYTHYGPGAASAATTASTTAAATASPPQQDLFVTQPQYGGSMYKTNAQWEVAAVNYLTGQGVTPSLASSAIYTYIQGGSLTAQQQGYVNLAIEGIGAPPSIPKAGPAPSPAPTPQPGGTPVPAPAAPQYIQASKTLGRYHFHTITQSQALALYKAGGPVYLHAGNRFYENVNPASPPAAGTYQTTSWGESHFPQVFRKTPTKP